MFSCKKGDVFFADLGDKFGSEQSGERPVLIIQNDIGNVYSGTTIVIPITSKNKNRLPTHVDVNLFKPSQILCEQIRTIDKQRLKNKVTTLARDKLKQVDEALKISLSL